MIEIFCFHEVLDISRCNEVAKMELNKLQPRQLDSKCRIVIPICYDQFGRNKYQMRMFTDPGTPHMPKQPVWGTTLSRLDR